MSSKKKSKGMAEKALAAVDEAQLWQDLAATSDLRLRLSTLKYLTDRRDGKPRQAREVKDNQEQPIQLVWGGPRPPWAKEPENK